MMDKTSDGLLSGILGAVLFVIFLFIFDVGVIPSLVIGGVGFGAGFLIFMRKKPEILAAETNSLEEGTKKLAEIRRLEKQIQKATMVSKVKEIDISIGKILSKIQKDPSKLKQAHQFLNYYLDATLKILNKYVELSAQNLHDQTILDSLKKVEDMLQDIKDAFDKFLVKLLSDDVLNLDTELSLLGQTIKMEGLGKE
jgi:5-bromo-4-chloroindolyl phosphate hydrolysis protein